MKNLKLIIVLLLITLGIGYPSWGQEKGLPASGNWPLSYTVSGNESVALTANVEHKGTVTIPNGAILTVTVADSYTGRDGVIYFTDTRIVSEGRTCIFDVQQGGKLIIRGRKGGPNPIRVLIEGNFWDLYATANFDENGLLKPNINPNDNDPQRNKYYKEPVIKCAGEVEFDYVQFQGNYVNVSGKGVVNFNDNSATAVSSFTDCVFTNNCAQCGSAFSMDVNSDGTVNVTNCEFRKSECHGYGAPGGVIKGTGTARAKVNVVNSKFHHNKSTGNAGAVYWSSFGDVTAGIEFSGCSFHNNWSNLSGGAILFEGLCSFAGSEDNMNVFYNNVALRNGGAISIEGFGGSGAGSSSIIYDINHVELYGNQSPCGAGLGVMMRSTYFNEAQININLTNCNIHDNTSIYHNSGDSDKMSGGGLYFNISDACMNTVTITLSNNNIHDNVAGYGAGVILKNGGSNTSITFGANNKIFNNKANQSALLYTGENLPSYWNYGGGVFASNGNVIVKGGQIYDNVAAQNGGAMYMKGGIFNFYQGEIGISGHPNTAVNGAGVYMDGGTLNMTDTDGVNSYSGVQLCYNNASTNGGALYVNGGTVNMVSGLVSQNSATTSGGGIYQNNGTLTISGNSTITGNMANTSGAGVYVNTTNFNMGAGSFIVRNNYRGTIEDDVYLPSGKYITVSDANFKPLALGIYTAVEPSGSSKVDVLYSNNTTILTNIYNGMLNGTYNIYDDRHQYQPVYPGSTDQYIAFGEATTPWSVYQNAMSASPLSYVEGTTDVYKISNAQELTAFMLLANNIQDCGKYRPTATPSAKGKLTADIDMIGQYWTPIGRTSPFTGELDGNGYTISHLTMQTNSFTPSYNSGNLYGLFGNVGSGATIKNLVLSDVNIVASGTDTEHTDVVGGVVAHNGGSIINSTISGQVTAGNSTARTMGGFVGNNTGNLKNSFATFSFTDSEGACHSGGLAGTNSGTIENCYIRTTAGSLPDALLAYNNNGTINYCYAPGNTGKNLIVEGTNPASSGTFTATGSMPYVYRQYDNLVNGTPLKKLLNSWVKSNNGTGIIYTYWNRPTTKAINGDYPLLKMVGSNAVTEDADGKLHYGNINTLMAQYTDRAFWFYGSENAFGDYSGNKLYIDEDAALTQASGTKGTINAHVGITLDNSAGAIGANPSQGVTDAIDWHFFSTSLSDAPLGITYTDNTPVPYEGTPTQYQHTGNGYFPANVNDYYNEWDFYAYYEPEFQWINFKRNSASHWNEIAPWTNIPYTNESTLAPGKGYMVALADPAGTLLQCTGTLNNGNVGPISLSCSGFYRKGLNLLGNPYQSYLDFEEFANINSSIWSSETRPYYIIIDEDKQGYVAFAVEQSKNTMTAGRYIHPHQGFMVVTNKSDNTATFTDGMRVTDVGSYDAHFRDQRIDYPLVNLIATDANGNRDIATAELGRPDKGGAILADFATMANCLVYVHYDDKDYRIAFTQPGITSLPIRFEAFENGTYTLTWDMENGEFGYMHLIDNITGTDVDMLTAHEYTFTANTDDLVSRFKLVFDYTGIDENGDADTNTGLAEVFAYMSKGQLVVEGEGTLQLIDMNGRVLQQARLHGDVNTVDLPQIATGLYVLKLDERTQKIVLE